MSRHRTIWDGGPSTWRQRGGSRRACVRWRSWVLTERPRQQRHAAGVLGSDNGARGDSQGVGGGWDTDDCGRNGYKYHGATARCVSGQAGRDTLDSNCRGRREKRWEAAKHTAQVSTYSPCHQHSQLRQAPSRRASCSRWRLLARELAPRGGKLSHSQHDNHPEGVGMLQRHVG